MVSLRSLWAGLVVSLAVYSFIGGPLNAQELEPRAFWVTPVGASAATFSFSHTRGEFSDVPIIVLGDVDSRTYTTQAGYYRAIRLLGRSANLTLTVPYLWGTAEGRVLGQSTQIRRSGLADASLRLAVNLMGAPAMTLPEFQKFQQAPEPILGVSLRVSAPTGQYDSGRSVNLGSNRWAFNPKLGWIYSISRRWLIELEAGVTVFLDNQDFRGQVRKQNPIAGAELNLVYRIRPGFWAALDTNFVGGGGTTVEGQPRFDLQRNVRVGGTITVPIKGGHILKASSTWKINRDFGGDHLTFAIAYQYTWLGPY